MKKAAIASICLAIVLWACAVDLSAVETASCRIVDDWEQTIALTQPAKRVIPLYGAFAEMLFSIGAGDAVIARTQADRIPPEILEVPSVGTHMRPNVEMIVGLKPDLVVQSASRRTATPEMERLLSAGIPVAVFAPRSFEGIFSTMERLGSLTGRAEAARSAVAAMRERLDSIIARTASAGKRPRVFFETRAEPLTAAGRGSMVQEILAAAGAENIVGNEDAVAQYNFEALLAGDPDYYIVQTGPMNRNPPDPRERPHFTELRAIREGKVIFVDELLYSRPGPRSVDAVAELAATLHPDRFPSGSVTDSTAQSGTPQPRPHHHDTSSGSITAGKIYSRLIQPLFRLILYIAIGLFIGNVIEVLQWTRYMGMLMRPLLRWGHLSDHTAVSFMAAFFSGVTANTLLMNAQRDGKISERELYFASLLNTLPSYFLHLPTTLSVLIPLVQMAGVYYLVITLAASVLRTAVLIVLGRRMLPEPAVDSDAEVRREAGKHDLWNRIWKTFRKRFIKVLTWTLPIYTIFFLLTEYGLFRWMEGMLARMGSFRIIPVEALSIVATQVVAEFTAGVAAAGALMSAGTLGVKETVLALLIGNIISTPVRAIRHQLPYYMGIFTPRLGLSLMVLGQLTRAASVLVLTLLFYFLYPA